MKRNILGIVLLLAGATWVIGCGGGGGSSAGTTNGAGNNGGGVNGGTTVSSVTLGAVGSTNVLLGKTVQLTPVAKDVNGNPVSVPASNFTYASSKPADVSVSSAGLVTALICPNPNQAVNVTVTESSSGKTASLPINVSIVPGGLGAHTVVFTSDRDGIVASAGQPKTTNIYAENLDTGALTQLTHNDGNGSSVNGSPSPDGTKVTFASNRTGHYEIYVVNADGSNVVAATANLSTNEMPRFSADSMKIIFASSQGKSGTGATQDNNGRDLYTVPLPSGGAPPAATRLTNTPDGVFAIDPQYSPDNTKIVFAIRPAGSATEDIFTMNADGANIVQRTNNGAVTRWPQYSPDGTQIVYVTNAGTGATQSNLDLMNADGTNQHTLLADPATALEPAFTPDGLIVFASTRSGSSVLHLLNLNGGSADATALGVQLQKSHAAGSNESFPHVRTCP
jgi:hypothetical protein